MENVMPHLQSLGALSFVYSGNHAACCGFTGADSVRSRYIKGAGRRRMVYRERSNTVRYPRQCGFRCAGAATRR